MKRILLLVLSLVFLQVVSQKKDKSSSFEIPKGTTSILQLKNGNTFLMEITKKEGIKVLLFDSLRKKIGSGKLSTKILGDKIGYHIQEEVFEVAGNIAIFLQVGEDRTPVLVRLIVDAKTGKLISEEKISTLDKIKGGAGYAVAFGDVDMPDFDIEKDPESEYYALIRYNTMAAETKDRIEVLHYGPDHKVISQAKYISPKDNYKYTRYLNAYVNKNNYVVICTYAFNTNATGGEEARFYVSQLSKGKSAFKQQELSYTDFYKGVNCHFEYNKHKQTIHMTLITGVSVSGNPVKGKTINVEQQFQNIDPVSLKSEKPYSPDFTQINDYYKEKMGNKKDFEGLLQKTAIDKSGNLILFYQETTFNTSSQGSVKTYLGDVALLTISPAGKTINSAVFPASVMGSGYAALSMQMVATENGNYVLFNNSVDNMNLPETKEAKTVKALGVAVPVKYTYLNNSVKREYLFKEPKEKKGNPYCDFSVANYNPLTKKFGTLYIEPEKKKASVIFVDLH